MKIFFVARSAWDDNPAWVQYEEQRLMIKLCMKYDEDFKSSLKKLGFVAKIFSETKVRKSCELNNSLASKTGYRHTIMNLTDKKGKQIIAFLDVNKHSHPLHCWSISETDSRPIYP